MMLVCTAVVIILIVRWRISARKQVDAAREHVEMNTNDAYMMNAMEVANHNVAYVTAGDTIPATCSIRAGASWN